MYTGFLITAVTAGHGESPLWAESGRASRTAVSRGRNRWGGSTGIGRQRSEGGATYWVGGCRCRWWGRSRRCDDGSGWATSAASPGAPASARRWSSSAVKDRDKAVLFSHTRNHLFGAHATFLFFFFVFDGGLTSRSSIAERVCIPRCCVLWALGRGSQAWHVGLTQLLVLGGHTGAEASIMLAFWPRGRSQRQNSGKALNSIIKMDSLPAGTILNLDPIVNLKPTASYSPSTYLKLLKRSSV